MRLIRSRDKGFKKVLESLVTRGRQVSGRVEEVVAGILKDVLERKDKALVDYTKKFDRVTCRKDQFRVKRNEVRKAYQRVSKDVLEIIEESAGRIRAFHERQRVESWFFTEGGGSIMGQLVTPLDRVGLYVPGGKAAYPSSVLMNAIPAQVAGVKSLAVCSPAPDGEINPYVLVSADLLGLDEIYRLGGAQAVAALAYGTPTVPRVDKIVGPGNIFVATAKKLVYGEVDIDMVAGPSEILILADGSAEPRYLAADLLSQAEHDELALCLLVTDSQELAEKVRAELERQLRRLPSPKIARASINGQGLLIIVRDLREGFEITNAIAPEHLEVVLEDPLRHLSEIRNAGSIFLGQHTPEAVGDYLAGPNHVLPTGGTARFFSTLGVGDFLKCSNLIYFSKKDLRKFRKKVAQFARLEGLEAHARSVLIRRP